MDKVELEKYYLDTTYSLFLNGIQYDCKIGDPSPAAVNALLSKEGTAAIITAWNPRSTLLTLDENSENNKRLKEWFNQNNFTVLSALGQGKDKNWQAEESFFVTGITQHQLEQLAIEFQQNAYVFFEFNKAVVLKFTDIWNETH